ncbi:MAG: hypothetical protein K8T20_19465, partial [Planctomycetes bacterium]|nr:hypothetical protein [Planctomycetota bacterium]
TRMKKLAAMAVLAAPLFLSACGNSYDMYRTGNHGRGEDDSYDAPRGGEGEEGAHSRTRPGAQVIYSSETQGGTGPGSYGGRSSTVITPEPGGVRIEGEDYGR